MNISGTPDRAFEMGEVGEFMGDVSQDSRHHSTIQVVLPFQAQQKICKCRCVQSDTSQMIIVIHRDQSDSYYHSTPIIKAPALF